MIDEKVLESMEEDGVAVDLRRRFTTAMAEQFTWREREKERAFPWEDFYRSRGKLLEFDLPGGIPESWPKLLQALNLDYHEDKQSAAA